MRCHGKMASSHLLLWTDCICIEVHRWLLFCICISWLLFCLLLILTVNSPLGKHLLMSNLLHRKFEIRFVPFNMRRPYITANINVLFMQWYKACNWHQHFDIITFTTMIMMMMITTMVPCHKAWVRVSDCRRLLLVMRTTCYLGRCFRHRPM